MARLPFTMRARWFRIGVAGFLLVAAAAAAVLWAHSSRNRFTTATTCEDGVPVTGPGLNLLTLPRVAVMGGWHRFHVEARSGDGGKLSYAVSKEGRDLEVVPRLAWKTPEGRPQGTWLVPVRVSVSPVMVEVNGLAVNPGLDPVLELWDNFHIVRYGVDAGRRSKNTYG